MLPLRWDNSSINIIITRWVEAYPTCLNIQVYNYKKTINEQINTSLVTFGKPSGNEKNKQRIKYQYLLKLFKKKKRENQTTHASWYKNKPVCVMWGRGRDTEETRLSMS